MLETGNLQQRGPRQDNRARQRRRLGGLGLLLALLVLSLRPASAAPERARARSVRVTILSTMLADAGIGEWGFAALVEVDGHRLLFDTGARPDTVLRNARELGLELGQITDVVLSHNHDDHTGGLVALRRELLVKNPKALSRAHVAPGIFWSRTVPVALAARAAGGLQSSGGPPDAKSEQNTMIADRVAYTAAGGSFVEHTRPEELFPGVWITGPIPRRFAERNWSGRREVRTPGGPAEDTLPEDQALVIDTESGLVVITGCGHAGIVNIVDLAQKQLGGRLHAVLGGLHLLEASDEQLDWTARELRGRGLAHLIGAHCTGIEALFRLRQGLGLTRRTAVVGAVGATFTLTGGIDPRRLAR